jgi:hypothetical protein
LNSNLYKKIKKKIDKKEITKSGKKDPEIKKKGKKKKINL